MKKYFSLTLLLAMVLTLVSTVPVQAALDNYPYIFLDYNEEIDSVTKKKDGVTVAKAVWASGKGVGGTGALKITDRNNANDALVESTLLDKESITRDSYKVSGWVKFVSANKLDPDGTTIDENQDGKPDQWGLVPNLKFGTVLTYGYKDNGVDTSYATTNFSNISTLDVTNGQWHYFEQTYRHGVDSFTADNPNSDPIQYPYDWTTTKPTKFTFRFLTQYCSSKFDDIFNGFKNNPDNRGGELIYYLDDYQYIPDVSKELDDGSVPVVTLAGPTTLEENFVGETVNISWDYTSTDIAVESKVVVRVFKKISADNRQYATDGWVLVDQQFADGDSFDYPLTEAMLGDKYKFEVFPYDVTSNSYIAGAIQDVVMTNPVAYPEVVRPKAETPITFTSLGTGNGGEITFELAEVENNRVTPLQLFTIIALYDANGALIDCKVNDLPPVLGNTSLTNFTHTEPLTDAVYNEVASARAFVWGGTDFDDTASHIAYIDDDDLFSEKQNN